MGRKRDAEVFEAEVVRRKRTGDLDLLTGGRETLADFTEEWWKLYAVPNLAPRTLRSYAGLWDRSVLPDLGSMRLNAITVEMVERYRAELEANGAGQPTIYRALSLLQGVLRRAVEWRRIGHLPTPGGGVWNETSWQTWHRDCWLRARKGAGVPDARP